jgi:hypothetical protein
LGGYGVKPSKHFEGGELQGVSAPSGTSEHMAPVQNKKSELHSDIIARVHAATSVNEVLRAAEDIPAIQRCIDKALSISHADKEDAHDAVLAIQRLASLSVEPNDWSLATGDRRFEQLSDIVELGLAEISSMDLCKYLWSISVLGFSYEDRTRAVFAEYRARMHDQQQQQQQQHPHPPPHPALTVGDLSTMIWTCACARNNLGWTDTELMGQLISSLQENQSSLDALSARLLVRVMWALYVYKDNSRAGRALGRRVIELLDEQGQGTHSAHHLSTTLMATSSLHLLEPPSQRRPLSSTVNGSGDDKDGDDEALSLPHLDHVARALQRLKGLIQGDTEGFSVSEIDITASALTELHEELLRSLQQYKMMGESTAADNNDNDDDIQGTEGLSASAVFSGGGGRDLENYSRKLGELVGDTRAAAESLVATSTASLSHMDVETCASAMKAAVVILPNHDVSREFTEAAAARMLVFVESWQAQHYFWSPTGAASVLESVAQMTWNLRGDKITSIGVLGKDRLDVELMQAKRLREREGAEAETTEPASASASASSAASAASLVENYGKDEKWASKFTPFQTWQRLAGLCSAICSSQADNINDPPLLIGSAWSCSCYSRPCPLLTAEVKSRFMPLKLESEGGERWTPTLLARLAMVMVSGQLNKNINNDKGDIESTLSQALLPALKLIPSLAERVDALVAFSGMGGGGRTIPAPAASEIAKAGAGFSPDRLSGVRTRALLRFMQADVMKSEAMGLAAKKILRKRKVDPHVTYAEISSPDAEAEQTTRLSLLAKLMLDWHNHKSGGRGDDHRLLSALVDSVKEAVRTMLPLCALEELDAASSSSSSSSSSSPSIGGSESSGVKKEEQGEQEQEQHHANGARDDAHAKPRAEPTAGGGGGGSGGSGAEGGQVRSHHTADGGGAEWTSADLVALSKVLQLAATHHWVDEELESLASLAVEAAIDGCDQNDRSSAGHRRLYDIGRIEGMLQLYRLSKQVHQDGVGLYSSKALFGFASGVARKFIPRIRSALVGALQSEGR